MKANMLVSDKVFRENQNTYYVQLLFSFENPVVYETMWKNIVERDRHR
jgi:hypothetical protein